MNHLWVVDASTDKVLQYSGATTRLSGSQEPASSFALNSNNGDPQGIADPLAFSRPDSAAVTTRADEKAAQPEHLLQAPQFIRPVDAVLSSWNESTPVATRFEAEVAELAISMKQESAHRMAVMIPLMDRKAAKATSNAAASNITRDRLRAADEVFADLDCLIEI